MKVITQYNYEGSPGEFNRLPSVTRLDQSMSVAEIIRRFVIEKAVPENVVEFPLEFDYQNDKQIGHDDFDNYDSFPQEFGDIAEVYVEQNDAKHYKKSKASIGSKAKQSDSDASDGSDGFAQPAGDDLDFKDGTDES